MGLDPFTVFVSFVAIMLVAFLLRTLTSSRRRMNRAMRECKACGATQPGFAKFCRRCGRAL
jgi:sensor c-di-GMP phosphodiesterase-like protein